MNLMPYEKLQERRAQCGSSASSGAWAPDPQPRSEASAGQLLLAPHSRSSPDAVASLPQEPHRLALSSVLAPFALHHQVTSSPALHRVSHQRARQMTLLSAWSVYHSRNPLEAVL